MLGRKSALGEIYFPPLALKGTVQYCENILYRRKVGGKSIANKTVTVIDQDES